MIDQQLKLKARIEKVIGKSVCDWKAQTSNTWSDTRAKKIVRGEWVIFRTSTPLTLAVITAISDELGTDKINFNFGREGSRHYSDLTPGSPDEAGHIQIFLDGIKDEEEV